MWGMISVVMRIRRTRSNWGRPISQLGKERRWSGAIRQGLERTKRVLGATGQSRHHLVGIDSNTFELGDELANYFCVRHPTP